MPDDQYLKEDAELKAQIAQAEAEAPPPPRDPAPLKELLESDFKDAYEGMDEEERQQFWQDLLSEIIVGSDKKVKRLKFFKQKSGVTGQ